jgi:hypothetical protein
MFDNLLQGDEKQAFHLVLTSFLWDVRTENYKDFVEDMLSMIPYITNLAEMCLKDSLLQFPLGVSSRTISRRHLQSWKNDIRKISMLADYIGLLCGARWCGGRLYLVPWSRKVLGFNPPQATAYVAYPVQVLHSQLFMHFMKLRFSVSAIIMSASD